MEIPETTPPPRSAQKKTPSRSRKRKSAAPSAPTPLMTLPARLEHMRGQDGPEFNSFDALQFLESMVEDEYDGDYVMTTLFRRDGGFANWKENIKVSYLRMT